MSYDIQPGKLGTAAEINAALANPVGTSTGSTQQRFLMDRFAEVRNVLDFGAVGNGSTNDTAALLAAFDAVPAAGGVVVIPAGLTFLFSAPLPAKSGTTITGGGKLVAAVTTAWPGGSPYFGITNVNNAASSITDANITVRGITIDFTACLPYDGTQHCVYIRKARRVAVESCIILGGSDSVALLGCDDTLIQSNRLVNFTNCGPDHWDGPSNGRVIGNHIETDVSAQMVNWNPDPTSAPSTGYTASGFVMAGNTLVSHEPSTTPCQIEPLRTGATVRGVTVTGNTFVNVSLFLRGDTGSVEVGQNIFYGFQSASEIISGHTNLGGTPSGVQITNNIIRDPITAAPNLGVVRMESDTAEMSHNFIMGTAYTAAAFYRGSTAAQRFGNFTQGANSIGILKNGFYVENGQGKPIGWTDAAGNRFGMFAQGDDNWIFVGTNASGGARTGLSWFQRSDTSEITASVPMLFDAGMRTTVETVAAAGTTLSAATPLLGNVCTVGTAAAGAADGVRVPGTVGRAVEVWNLSGVTINVWPNAAGAQINNSGNGVAVTIASGAMKTFRALSSTDTRVIATG
jgi:hypothetical protein